MRAQKLDDTVTSGTRANLTAVLKNRSSRKIRWLRAPEVSFRQVSFHCFAPCLSGQASVSCNQQFKRLEDDVQDESIGQIFWYVASLVFSSILSLSKRSYSYEKWPALEFFLLLVVANVDWNFGCCQNENLKIPEHNRKMDACIIRYSRNLYLRYYKLYLHS